jgi:hypothetical protein
MLEATSYGLIALGVVLVAAFCFVWVEENSALQVDRLASLADERKMNPLRNAGAAGVDRSRTESAGREELTAWALPIQMTSPAQAHSSGPDGNSLPRERGPEGVSHG